MLQALHITNYALIEEIDIDFRQGFTVLTGETGAGKSIVIGALGMILGDRTSSDVIRTGAESARVEAVFALDELHGATEVLKEYNLWDEGESQLIVTREIVKDGPNRCFVNGRRASVTMLKEIGKHLVDIHGQHDHQSLLRADSHLAFLDAFAGPKATQLSREIGNLYRTWRKAVQDLDVIQAGERERLRQIDLLKFQLDEISEASLQVGEEEELLRDEQTAAQAERLLEVANHAYALLYASDDPMKSAVIDSLGRASEDLHSVLQIDPKLQEAAVMIEEAEVRIQEAASMLRQYTEQFDPDPERLAKVQERLAVIRHLKRKYGDTVEAVLEYADQVRKELGTLEQAEMTMDELEDICQKSCQLLNEKSGVLSNIRKQAAETLRHAVETELKALNMASTRFSVSVEPLPHTGPQFTSTGADQIEFMIAPNQGEPLRPLARIASGGEMSRVMLALKSILADVDAIPTLIFDEVDTGIGGGTAEIVGQKLQGLANRRQVISITHLPQVASFASDHYLIQKATDGDRTTTRLVHLDSESRIDEIARMLGGSGQTGKNHAKAMLKMGSRGMISHKT